MFYLIDKPVWPSSNQTLSQIRRYLQTNKVGHTGTLDPLASGLLIVATQGSTKLLSLLDSQSKWYDFTFDITQTSDSFDRGTETISLPKSHKIFQEPPSYETVEKTLKWFIGTYGQIPPKYSAISLDGKRSYREARKGNVVNIPSRKITVWHLELTKYAFPNISLRVHISSGGYVRGLARDIGNTLGGLGLVTYLRRTQIDTIYLESQKMDYLELHPGEKTGLLTVSYETMFPDIGRLDITEKEYWDIFYGQSIAKREEYTGNHIFGYYENYPLVLLRQNTDSYAPIRFKIG